MTWNTHDADYPEITIKNDHVTGVSLWLEKIAELAPQYTGAWNVMIADIWPNDKHVRLIGHVQMDDVAVGYDTGYRVCAYLHGCGIMGDTDETGCDTDLVMEWLHAAAASTLTNVVLSDLRSSKPFVIRLTSYGDGPISKLPMITF